MYFFLLLTQATAQAVHILSHPSLGVGKIICSLVEAGKVTRHTCLYMSLHVRTGQIVTKEERDGDRELRAKQPGESGEGRDPRWSCRSSHDRTAENLRDVKWFRHVHTIFCDKT